MFFDGTLFTDDEMIVAGLGTEDRPPHGACAGERSGRHAGTARGPAVAAAILLHINNSNPILLADSPERRQVEAAGFEVAYDGMEVRL